MCTVISYKNKDHYFGRNLDLEHFFLETVTITPRKYKFSFHYLPELTDHFAMIGMASIIQDYPLYYEATNEHGLSIAGLNFPGNAVYFEPINGMINLAPYELIPWILGKFKSVQDVKTIIQNVNIAAIPFSKSLPLSPLHWMISDRSCSIVLESTSSGLQIYDNPVNILTNNPPFPFHLQNLANYINITAEQPQNRFSPNLNLAAYSRGMGAIGLPGDLSSASRFIRGAFVLHNSIAASNEDSSVSQFFHILDSVSQQRGCVKLGTEYEETIYSCCCNTNSGIYYYRTYDNSRITAVNMFHCDLAQSTLFSFPLNKTQSVLYEN